MRIRTALQIPPATALMAVLAGCASFDLSRSDYLYQEVHYVTTRGATGSADPDKAYGNSRGEAGFGVAMVAIDPAAAFSPYAAPQPGRVLRQEELLRAAPLQQLRALNEAAFFESLGRPGGRQAGAPEVLVFIHGYKRSFADSVTNAARLRHELAFPGPVIAFSWPSVDSMSGYLPDRENLDWSAPQLARLIERIAGQYPQARIHLLAHSLGNRALLEALRDLAARTRDGDWPVGEIILIAPDLDRAIFSRALDQRLAAVPSRITLYVSSKDIPLMASTSVYQYPRLGDSSEGVPVLPGVETIDVSDAITILNGHGYYEADPATIADLHHLLLGGKGAADRPTLVETASADGTYWRLQPRPWR